MALTPVVEDVRERARRSGHRLARSLVNPYRFSALARGEGSRRDEPDLLPGAADASAVGGERRTLQETGHAGGEGDSRQESGDTARRTTGHKVSSVTMKIDWVSGRIVTEPAQFCTHQHH